MILWARNRRVLMLGLILVVTVASSFASGTRSVVLPAVFGTGAATTPLVAFAPVLWGSAIAQAFASRTQALEARPCRRLLLLDSGLFLVSGLAAAIAYSRVVTVAGPSPFGIGSMLIATGLAGWIVLREGAGAAAFGLSCLAVLTSMYGVRAPAARYVRVFAPDGDPWWSLTCGCVVMGVALGAVLSERVNTRLRPDDLLD